MVWAIRLSNLAIGLALVVVFLGAWTRLNHAGLGCPDWPACYGEWILPSGGEAFDVAQQRYPDQPIEAAKGWLEMIHRYAAGLLGMLILGMAALAWKKRELTGYPVRLTFAVLALVIVQAVFGMWTVTLKLLPQIVTLHLLGGLLTLSLLVLIRQHLGRVTASTSDASVQQPFVERRWVKLGVVLLFGQIMLGGWTSANYAGWACIDWIQCDRSHEFELDFNEGFALPAINGQNHEGGLKSLEARAAIQTVHRIGALVVSVYLLGLAFTLIRRYGLLWPSGLLVALVAGQNLLGILNVVLGVPISLAIAHHAGAVLLLVSLLWLNAGLNRRVTEGYCYAH